MKKEKGFSEAMTITMVNFLERFIQNYSPNVKTEENILQLSEYMRHQSNRPRSPPATRCTPQLMSQLIDA